MTAKSDFERSVKAWQQLDAFNLGNLSNREVLEDTVRSMCMQIDMLRPHIIHGGPPISAGLLTELAGSMSANVRWLKGILARTTKPKPVAHGAPKVKMEDVLPY